MTLDRTDPDDAEVLDLLAEARSASSGFADLSDAEAVARALQLLVSGPRRVSRSGSTPSSAPSTPTCRVVGLANDFDD